MKIRKAMLAICLTGALMAAPTMEAHATVIPIVQIIKEGIKKVIRAVDLMIQRLQTKTIGLQNAEKVLENKLSKLKLASIAKWNEKHRKLYQQYFNELWQVKNAFSSYQHVKHIVQMQLRIAREYKSAIALVKQDGNFTKPEVYYMFSVYKGILSQSIRNLDELSVVINSYKTQMSDAQRLSIIAQTGQHVEQNLFDLLEFNASAGQIGINRAKKKYEIDKMKKLYGLHQ